MEQIYKLTAAFPSYETYGLTAQLRRAAVSIPANIAEGVGRGAAAETARFAQISLGSVYELHTLLEVASSLEFCGGKELMPLRERLSTLSRRLSAFIRYKRSLARS